MAKKKKEKSATSEDLTEAFDLELRTTYKGQDASKVEKEVVKKYPKYEVQRIAHLKRVKHKEPRLDRIRIWEGEGGVVSLIYVG